MKYLLDKLYRLRGWQGAPTGLYDTRRKEAKFLPKDQFLFLMRCDGAHDLDEAQLTVEEKKLFEETKKVGVIRPASFLESLRPELVCVRYVCRFGFFQR